MRLGWQSVIKAKGGYGRLRKAFDGGCTLFLKACHDTLYSEGNCSKLDVRNMDEEIVYTFKIVLLAHPRELIEALGAAEIQPDL